MTSRVLFFSHDQKSNSLLFQEFLEEKQYIFHIADTVDNFLQALENHVDIKIIFFDNVCDDVIKILKFLKENPEFYDFPIIVQIDFSSYHFFDQCLLYGVDYCLTMPYTHEELLKIFDRAVDHHKIRHEKFIKYGNFRFQTLDDAKALSFMISQRFINSYDVMLGLNELLINAIEHGNLGITYTEKKDLIFSGKWEQEIQRRLNLQENKNKYAELICQSGDKYIQIHIKDQGNGFDWKPYMDISEDRVLDPHGRGIAVSRMISFPNLRYLGKGNEIMCEIEIDNIQ